MIAQHGGEVCDGTELADVTCEGLGYDSGELGCATDCRTFDNAACDGAGVCGNGFVDNGEACDDGSEPPAECPYDTAPCTLCSSDCEFVEGTGPTCGDGVVQGNEECEPGETTLQSCDGRMRTFECGDWCGWAIPECDG